MRHLKIAVISFGMLCTWLTQPLFAQHKSDSTHTQSYFKASLDYLSYAVYNGR
jgi:hypothetical protein